MLNPLFLDELRSRLEEAANNPRMLLNLRKRISKIRIFDPACGSGNFLVIAYKEMRAIEAEINRRRDEPDRRTEIPLTNFRGIEVRDFPAEIARLALIIAEFQCDVLHRGQKEALAEFLPLDAMNWITCGNALRLDWLSVCPPTGTRVKHDAEDLFHTPLDQAQIDFENEGGETYICGNPPYKGNADQTKEQKSDIEACFSETEIPWKSLDYICGWFWKAKQQLRACDCKFAFVSTNSISQGQNISFFWKELLTEGIRIEFAERSFLWKNLAAKCGRDSCYHRLLADKNAKARIVDGDQVYLVENISPYLVPGRNLFIEKITRQLSGLPKMVKGNYYGLSEGLLMPYSEKNQFIEMGLSKENLRTFKGGAEIVKGTSAHAFGFPSKSCQITRPELNEFARGSLM